ncbi:MAG TPA: hypothetical protein VFG46_11530 [Chryseolinea sp.]|nr:hypothetical protein [Chryseolinea sp.]
MISVTSGTNAYILQPSLLEKHRRTLNWLSSTLLWQREFNFFQKLLDQNAAKLTSVEDKKKIDHFQNLILYYNSELIPALRKKLRDHENRLADMLKTRNETKTEYFKEHDALMQELESFNLSFIEYKEELFEFIEKVI